MRSKRASPGRFTSFARVCPPIRHDRLRIFFPVGQGPEGVIGSDSRLGHEACKCTSRKKLKFLKAVTSPRLRSASPDRLIASLHDQRICGVNRVLRQRKPEQNSKILVPMPIYSAYSCTPHMLFIMLRRGANHRAVSAGLALFSQAGGNPACGAGV